MERYEEKKKSRNTFLTFVLITFNLWMIHFLIGLSYFIYAPIFFSVIVILWWFFRLVSKRKIEKDKIDIKEIFPLSWKFIRINYKHMLATIVGIIIASIILSQFMIMSSTFDQVSFDNFMENDQENAALKLSFYDIQSVSDARSLSSKIIKDVENLMKMHNLQLTYYHNYEYMRYEIATYQSYDWDSNYMATININSINGNQEYWDLVSQFPSVKKSGIVVNESTSIFFLDNYYKESFGNFTDFIEANKTIDIMLDDQYRVNENSSLERGAFDVFEMNITDVIYLQESDFKWFLESGFSYESPLYGSFIISNTTYFDKIGLEIKNSIKKEWLYSYQMEYDFYINLQITNRREISDLYDQLQILVRDVSLNFGRSDVQYYYYYDVYSPLMWQIQYYEIESAGTRIVTLLIALPMLTLALFLVYFSINLIEGRKKRLLAVMRTKGTSRVQIQAFLLSEVISTGFVAMIVGSILSIPWTLYTFRSWKLLINIVNINDLVIPVDYLWKLPLIGIILTLDLNFASILSLTRVDITEAEEYIEKNPPLWQRLKLDLVFFTLAIIFWFVIRYIPFSDPYIKEFVTLGIGFPALGLILITAPLIVGRYFGNIITFISNILWTQKKDLTALATRNLWKNRFSASRLAALLMLGLMLSLLTIMLPGGFSNVIIESDNYWVGADLRIIDIDPQNATQMAFLNDTRIDAYSRSVSMYMDNPNNDERYTNDLNTYKFMGIDPKTYADVGYWKEEFADSDLSEIVKAININGSIGMQTDAMDVLKLNIGDTISLAMNKTAFEDFDITTSFKYMPNLVSSLPRPSWDNPEIIHVFDLYVLSSIDTIENLAATYGIEDLIHQQVCIDLKDNVNVTAMIEDIVAVFGNDIDIYFSYMSDGMLEDEIMGIISPIMQMLYIVTILTSTIGILSFSYLTFSERSREIGVFRAMGMHSKQVFQLLILEAVTLLAINLLAGVFVAAFLTINIVYTFKNIDPYSAPPLHFTIPWLDMTGFVFLMFILTLIGAGLPAFRFSRKQTGSILRGE